MNIFLTSDIPQVSGEKISTGVSILDKQLNGGFLKKSFIDYDIGSNYNFKVLIYYLINTHKVLYITTCMSPEQIIRNVEHIGFNSDDDIFISVYDRYFNVKPSEYRSEMDIEIIQYIEGELEKFRLKIGEYANCGDDWIIVVDTLSFFLNLEYVDKYHKLHLVRYLNNLTRELNTLCYLIVLKDAQQGQNKETEVMVKDLCNVVMDANFTNNENGEIMSVLTISKMFGEEINSFIM
jgi:KaiC/GvpD/RAD55 family RecA-like ATPase